MFCGKCGASNPDAGNFCVQCGASLANSATAVAAPASGNPVFAGFWIRVGAYMIDYIAILFASLVVMVLVLGAFDAAPASAGLYVLMSIVGPWLYAAFMESGRAQATLGKMAVGIKVTDLEGNRIGFGRATGRYFAEWITGLTLGFGYAMNLFTAKRQTLHDMMAGTVVVRREADPASVAAAPPAKPANAALVALAVLAAIVPTIGILAAIAIPAYQDYTIRSQVTEGLVLASDVKAGVAEYAANTGNWPASLAESGMNEMTQEAVGSSHYVASIDVADGTITISYGRKANQRIQDARLSLRPFVTAEGDIAWQCGNAEVVDIDASGSGRGITDLADKYMPAACRAGFGSGL